MANGIGVAPVASASTDRNLSVMQASKQNLEEKMVGENQNNGNGSQAADKVVLSPEAKAASASSQAGTTPEVTPAADSAPAAAPRDMQAIKKDIDTVVHELKSLNVSEKDVSKALTEAAVDLKKKTAKSIQKAVSDHKTGITNETKFAKALDKIAADQAEGVLDALKGLRDQAAKPADNAATPTAKPEVETPKADLAENVSANVSKDGSANGKVDEKTPAQPAAKVAEKIEKAEDNDGGRFVGTASAPGLSGSNGSNGFSRLSGISAFADKQLEKITERLSFLQNAVSALKLGVNSKDSGGSAFDALRMFTSQLDRADRSVARADLSGATLKMEDLEGALGSLVKKAREDKAATRSSGTFLQGGFGVGFGSGGSGSGGPAVHTREDSDNERSGFMVGSAGGIGMGQFTGRAKQDSLLTSFGGIHSIGGAVSGSKLSVVA